MFTRNATRAHRPALPDPAGSLPGGAPVARRGRASGVNREEAAVLAATQRPAAPAQFTERSGPPAWKTIPSWSLIGTQDRVIPRALQEEMSRQAGAHITRVRAGHLSLITHPPDATKVILAAVDATSKG